MPTISVIIPTYNRAAQVLVAVRSVLEQTCPPNEVIVIDDGSTDSTSDILAPLFDRIRYIRTPNTGASAARNRGIREATSDWIAFLDSDDTWRPQKIEKQLACIRQTSARVCFCVSVDETGQSIDDLQSMDPSLDEGGVAFYPAGDCRMLKHRAHPFIQSMLVEKAALARCGAFDETMVVAEDTKLIHRLVLAHGYGVVLEKLVNISRARSSPGLSDTMDADKAYLRYECYVRAQSEVYWRVVPIDARCARVIRNNLLYFVSRQAEIACALGREATAKRLAYAGIKYWAGWKCIIRNLIILLAHPMAARKFSTKWAVNRFDKSRCSNA